MAEASLEMDLAVLLVEEMEVMLDWKMALEWERTSV